MKNKFLLLLLLSVTLSFISCNACSNERKSIKEAEKARLQKNNRSITVINKTDEKYIKKCILQTGSGTQIDFKDRESEINIVFRNFDPNGAYRDETDFKITLIDRFGLHYEKIFSVKKNGNTDVEVTESDYAKRAGDALRIFNKQMNKKSQEE